MRKGKIEDLSSWNLKPILNDSCSHDCGNAASDSLLPVQSQIYAYHHIEEHNESNLIEEFSNWRKIDQHMNENILLTLHKFL